MFDNIIRMSKRTPSKQIIETPVVETPVEQVVITEQPAIQSTKQLI
jgi:hypothetical protein